jgi:hypothetical protein
METRARNTAESLVEGAENFVEGAMRRDTTETTEGRRRAVPDGERTGWLAFGLRK